MRVGLLGPLEVIGSDGPVEIVGDRARSLLAILALTPGRAVAGETLVERCWGATLPADPRNSLNTAIHRLRTALGPGLVETAEAGYLLAVPPESVDVVTFEHLLASVGTANLSTLDTALELWRGEPFGPGYCDWLTAVARPRLVERWLSAVERAADLRLATGSPARSLTGLQEAVQAHPLRESSWARLLSALTAEGRRSEALEQYAAARARIVDELGVEPGPELQAVFRSLLADDDPPPRRAAAAAPQQLPSDVPHFHGRADLLAVLDDVQPPGADDPTATVVLHGLGGSGKTSLAVHWGQQAAARFPDGRMFVDLHGYGPAAPVTPAAALEGLLRGIGVSTGRIPSDVDGRSALWRTELAGRRILLVLDNARSEEQVRPLLPGTGALVLVTSRGRLRGLAARDGARPIPVGALPLPEAADLLGARVAGERGLLVTVADRCGRLPLALAILAERLHSSPGRLPEVAAEIADAAGRLDALGADDPATDLRTVLSWSYAALDPDTARFFRLLGVGPAPTLTVESAAALTDTPRPGAGRVLRRLVDLNLLTETTPGRFQLHDLVRAYAAERCDTEDGAETRRVAAERLLDWYLYTAAAAVASTDVAAYGPRHLGPPPPGTNPLQFADSDAGTAWYVTEGGALAGIVEFAARHGHHAHAARLAVMMWRYLYHRAAVEEALTVQQTAIASARVAGLRSTEALVTNHLGTTYGMRGDLDAAETHFTTALTLFGADDPAGLVIVHDNLGVLHSRRGDHLRAAEHLLIAADLARKLDNPSKVAKVLSTLADTWLQAGRLDDALEAGEGALRALSDLSPVSRGEVLETFGEILVARGDPGAGVPYLERAILSYLAFDNRPAAANSLVRLGAALRDIQAPDRARMAWQQAIELMDESSALRLDVDREHVLGLIAALPDRDAP